MSRFSGYEGAPNAATAHQGPLTVSSTATTLATLGVTLHAQTQFVVIAVEDYSIRYTVNGTTPTSTLGFRHYPSDGALLISREQAANIKLIRAESTDAKIQVAQMTR